MSEGVRAYEHVSVDFSTHMLLYFHAIHDVTKNASDKQSTNGEMTAGERAAKRESAREGGREWRRERMSVEVKVEVNTHRTTSR